MTHNQTQIGQFILIFGPALFINTFPWVGWVSVIGLIWFFYSQR